jgi:protein-S-isoprenylcysteine O-methyltransferase Ste14
MSRPPANFAGRAVLSVVTQMTIWGGLLLLPAALLDPAAIRHWWRAWVFLLATSIAAVAVLFGVFPGREDLYRERMKPPIQQGQPLADKVILISFLVAYCGANILIPLDLFRFHLLARPNTLISFLGLVVYLFGWLLIALALRDNTFAAPVVKHQTERQHSVADTGVYAFVRHPMYAGFLPLMLGVTLWLESYAAAVFAIVPMALLMVRIAIEERFLRRELQGYDAYMQRVRYRLIPGVW